MKQETNRYPLEWMLIAKGIGILLVVIGHFSPELSPTYWVELNKFIYSFHMPLFFILSGYLYKQGKYPYLDFIKNKAQRLLYPFISIGIVFFVIKYVVGRFVKLEHPVDIHSLYILLIDPANSYMPLLWFVHALFLIFSLYPLLRLFLTNYFILLLLFVINIFGDHLLGVQNMIANMPFFIVGVILQENKKLSAIVINPNWRFLVIALVVFFISYAIHLSIEINPLYAYLKQFMLGIIGAWVVITMSVAISTFTAEKPKELLQQVGYYSMTIYLFHTLFESAIRIGFTQLINYAAMPFELIALIAIAAGIFFPLLLEKNILRNYWLTKKFILGLS